MFDDQKGRQVVNSCLFCVSGTKRELQLKEAYFWPLFCFLSFRMNTLLNTKETPNTRQFHETREQDKAIQTCHVRAAPHLHGEADKCECREEDRLWNQGQRLFPEFFTHHRASCAEESHYIVMSLNRKPEHSLNDPLIHSWLNMYGFNQYHNLGFESNNHQI